MKGSATARISIAVTTRVDHGRQHSHVVRRDAIETLFARREAPEDIASTDDDGDLDAEAVNVLDLRCDPADDVGIDAEALLAHESLAAELQQDTFVFEIFTHPALL
jgi:hypothetical protein